jgi:2-phosphoglycolate phosphatase
MNGAWPTLLFDLDGTLIDSAPDLAGAANDLRIARGLGPLPYEDLRPMVGSGARGMVGVAFGIVPGDSGFEGLRDEFLRRYEARMTIETRFFKAVVPLLDELDRSGRRWGVVTNKAARFTEPIARHFGLDRRASALVAGDSTPHSKPHPAPLLEAARRMAVEPQDCVYIGDDLRDVLAGRAAGMATVAAAWGYLGNGPGVAEWGADAIIESPMDLLHWRPMA